MTEKIESFYNFFQNILNYAKSREESLKFQELVMYV